MASFGLSLITIGL